MSGRQLKLGGTIFHFSQHTLGLDMTRFQNLHTSLQRPNEYIGRVANICSNTSIGKSTVQQQSWAVIIMEEKSRNKLK